MIKQKEIDAALSLSVLRPLVHVPKHAHIMNPSECLSPFISVYSGGKKLPGHFNFKTLPLWSF